MLAKEIQDALAERCRCAFQSAGRPQSAKKGRVSHEPRPARDAVLQMDIDRSQLWLRELAVAGSETLRRHGVASDYLGDWRNHHPRDGRRVDLA